MNARLIMPYSTPDKDFNDCIEEAQHDLIKDILTFNYYLQSKKESLNPRLCTAIKTKIDQLPIPEEICFKRESTKKDIMIAKMVSIRN
jgi:hypothetical protein